MIPTATIVFREFLEIALVLTIVLAATSGLKNRMLLVSLGLLAGVVGSVAIAFFMDGISEAMDGIGQEIFNAAVLFVAVGLLSWTVIWMKTHGRELSQNIKKMGADVTAGNRSLYVIVGVVAFSTLREGAEIVLFSYGMLATDQHTMAEILLGGLLGAVGGVLVGAMIYVGLIRAAQKHLFVVTSWLLILLTAGMAAKGASYLVAADVLPALGQQMWDMSGVLASDSFLGETLGVLIGYSARPTGVELVFYVMVLLIVGGGYRFAGRHAA